MLRFSLLLAAMASVPAVAQSLQTSLDDKRLSVHTLLREDIFAGVLDGDMGRLAKGEKNLESLLQQRPADKAALLVWKGSVILYRAVRAREANRHEEFDQKYQQAIDLLAQAKKLAPGDFGVTAATAGAYSILADRLPEKLRAPAWETAYANFRVLWKAQGQVVDRLPLHLRGELLGGLALSAQRTGRAKEAADFLDKILEVAPDTPYARAASEWKENPKMASTRAINCLSCHNAGRLAARQGALENK
jgi:tetratricopeptide (TPR) repeat protein